LTVLLNVDKFTQLYEVCQSFFHKALAFSPANAQPLHIQYVIEFVACRDTSLTLAALPAQVAQKIAGPGRSRIELKYATFQNASRTTFHRNTS
jgi:hypothetical protein